MTPETPITDALWAHLSQHGWGREHLPCSTIMESHEKLERELADERALADRLAEALENATSWGYAKPAFDAWKEARK